jgi:hypothetical protein
MRKIVEVGNDILNTFDHWHFFQIFIDFELIKRFRVKGSLTGFLLIWAYCCTYCKSTRAPFWTRSVPLCSTVLSLQSGWHAQCNSQDSRRYDISKISTCLYKNLETFLSLELSYLALFGPSKQIFPSSKFLDICRLPEYVIRNNFSFGSVA